jgi:hypothetical protein
MDLMQKQYKAISMMLSNKKNYEIVKELEITEEIFFSWLNDPYFIERLNDSLYDKFKKEYENKKGTGTGPNEIKQRSIVLSLPNKYYSILEKHFELKNSTLANGLLEIIIEYMEKNRLL